MNYKNNLTGNVIGEFCYNRLPVGQQLNYSRVEDEPTHRVENDEDDDLLNSSIAFGEISSMDTSSSDTSSSTSSNDFGGFDGGDTGGGGASGDF